MKTPQDVIDNWSARVMADPKKVAKLDAVYKFVVRGSGGGSWIFNCKNPVSVSRGDGPAECVISLGSEDFVALGNGQLNPQMAFMSGRLDVEGDLELALKLGEITG